MPDKLMTALLARLAELERKVARIERVEYTPYGETAGKVAYYRPGDSSLNAPGAIRAIGNAQIRGGVVIGDETVTPGDGDLRVEGGVKVGSTASDAAPGNVEASGDGRFSADGRFGGGISVGSEATDPATGVVRATDDVRAGGGVYAGNADGNPNAGDVIADVDGRFGGGVWVGRTSSDPAADTFHADGDASIGGGLYVGNNNVGTATGQIQATSHIRTDGGLFLGNKSGGVAGGNLQMTGSILQSNAIYCVVKRTTSVTHASGSWYAITFTAEEHDTGSFFTPSSPHVYIPYAGTYLIIGEAAWDNAGDYTERRARITRNGVTIAHQAFTSIKGSVTRANLSAIDYCAANNYINLYTRHIRGSNLNVSEAWLFVARIA